MSDVITLHVDEPQPITLDYIEAKIKPEVVGHATPTEQAQTVTPAPGTTFSAVEVEAIPPEYIKPTGTIGITENGETDVREFESALVAVPQPSGKITITENGTGLDIADYAEADVSVQPNLQTPDPITPTEQQQTITPGTGYDGLAQAVVEPIPQEYIKPSGWVLDEMDSNGFPTRAKFYPQGENTKIGNSALASWNGGPLYHISVLDVPEGTTAIGNSAFSYTSITHLILPSTLVGIGDYHVRYCSKLQYIEYRCDCNLFTGYYGGTDLRQMVFRKNVGRIINPSIPSTIELYDFSGSTAIPVLNSAAAVSFNENTKIKIPYALSDEYLGVGNGWQSKQYWSELPSFLWQVQNN